MVGGVIVFYFSHKDGQKIKAGIPRKAEDRLPVAMIGGVIFPVTMFWFAWTAEYNSIHWIAPTIAGTFLATGIMLIFVGYLNYLTDTYLMFTASAMAANTICRSACGAAAPLFTEQMFNALGVGGGGSLIGGFAVLLAPIPFIFYRYGERIRVKSKFAPTAPPKEQRTDDEEKQQNQIDSSSPERADDSSSSAPSDSEANEEYGADYPSGPYVKREDLEKAETKSDTNP